MVEFGTYYPQYNVSFTAGDVFCVSVESGVVKYKKNGVVYHTSSGIPTYPLKVDTALYTTNSTLTNVVVGGNWSGGSGGGGSSSSSEVLWLVADHLGTPRMILDQTGWLTNVKRHDYLPFGEELFAGTGGRTTGQGYTASDNVRQKFTSKERDNETGLDYSVARYYSFGQGRFTSSDSLISSGTPAHPQSWNRFNYCLNNPLIIIDPSGLIWGVYTDKDGVHYQWYRSEEELQREKEEKNLNTTVVTNFLIDMGNGTWAALNPNAGEHKISGSRSEAQRDLWGFRGLPSSWQDFVPVWGATRRFFFSYATGDYELALVNFGRASVEGGTGKFAGALGVQRSFATKPGEAIFFSGQGTVSLATQAAASEGGKIMGNTIGGKATMFLAEKLPQRLSTRLIDYGSKKFAQGASGEIRVFLNQPTPSSTWVRVEYPILRVNPFARVKAQ